MDLVLRGHPLLASVGCGAFQAEEMREFQMRMREWPTARLEAEGYSLFNLIPSLRGSFFKSVHWEHPHLTPSTTV